MIRRYVHGAALVLFAALLPASSPAEEPARSITVEWSDGTPELEVKRLVEVPSLPEPVALAATPFPHPAVLAAFERNGLLALVATGTDGTIRPIGTVARETPFNPLFVEVPSDEHPRQLFYSGTSAALLEPLSDGQWKVTGVELPGFPLTALFAPRPSAVGTLYLGLDLKGLLAVFSLIEGTTPALQHVPPTMPAPSDFLPVAGDLFGDGSFAIVRKFSDRSQLWGVDAGKDLQSTITDIPDAQSVLRAFRGELDGIPGLDLLVETTPLPVFWLCSGGSLPRCTPLKLGPYPVRTLALSDLDRDGVDEVLWYHQGAIYSGALKTGAPVTNADLLAENGMRATLSPEGTAGLPLGAAAQRVTIEVRDGPFKGSYSRTLSPRSRNRVVLLRQQSHAALPSVEQPSCIGYRGRGKEKIWGRAYSQCPLNHAVVELDDGLIRSISCCPLPRSVELEESEEVVDTLCPPGKIVTGVVETLLTRRVKLRCRGIRTPGVAVGAREPGVYWGTGLSMRFESDAIIRSQIPPAVRLGAGRISRDRWDEDGCMGRPHEGGHGSVLVGRVPGRCSLAFFAPLLRNNAPLPLFAPCEELPDPLNPLRGCDTGRAPPSAG